MNQPAIVLVSVIAAAATAALVSVALRPAAAAVPMPDVGDLRAAVRELEASNDRLQGRIEQLVAQPAPARAPAGPERTAAAVLGPEQVAAAVEEYLRRRGDGPADAAAGRAFDLDADFDALVGSSYWENPTLWRSAFDAGRMDDVIGRLEAAAEASPTDVAAKLQLADAYLAYLQMDSSKWGLSMKADRQFDAVLDIDDSHWQARFSKAISYTFWPDFLGKKQEAVQHFETLVSQQRVLPVEDRHAETYLVLGNLLSERDPERAREIWREGAQRHPNSQELRAKVGN